VWDILAPIAVNRSIIGPRLPSSIHHRPSIIVHPSSSIHHRPSIIVHPSSAIHHPPSSSIIVHHPPSSAIIRHHPPSSVHHSLHLSPFVPLYWLARARRILFSLELTL
jgi:hypothetical protein